MHKFENISSEVKYSEEYLVNRVGEVYSKRSKKILTPYQRKAYLVVSLSKQGKKNIADIHRIVALTFVKGYETGKVVNHIDNNPHNNHCSNLEWVTQKQNVHHAISIGAWDTERTYQTNKGKITKKIKVTAE